MKIKCPVKDCRFVDEVSTEATPMDILDARKEFENHLFHKHSIAEVISTMWEVAISRIG